MTEKNNSRHFLSAFLMFFIFSFLFFISPVLAATVWCEYVPRDSSQKIIYFEGDDADHRPWSREIEEAECLIKCTKELSLGLMAQCASGGGILDAIPHEPEGCDATRTTCAQVDIPTLTVKCKFTPKKSDGSALDGAWETLTTSETECQNLCDTTKTALTTLCARLGAACTGIFDEAKTTCEKSSAFAEPTAPYQFESITPSTEIPLPTFGGFADITIQGDAPNRYLLIPWLGQYIAAIYKYAIGIVGILSGIMIAIGGLLWLTAGGAADRISTAKSFIESSLVGLVIALTSYLLLYAINPNLTEFDSLRVRYIERVPLSEDWTPLTQEEVQENITSPDSTPTPAGSATPASMGPIETGENNVPYFAQFRGEWAEKCCGSDPENGSCPGYTLKASGCRLTSYAMILKYYFPDQNVDPGVVSLLGGARCNINETQLSNGPWGQISIESINIGKAKELLDQKKPIIILCRPCVGLTNDGSSAHKYKGHYMVLTGYHGDTFNVNDPGSNPNKRISSMTAEMIRNPCNFVSSDDESRVEERCQNPVSNPSLYYLHPIGR